MLRRWREFAEWAAKVKGARRACGLCKRATMGRAAVVVRPPWVTYTDRKRRLCSECWAGLCAQLDTWEYERDGYDLPIDRVSRKETDGGGFRGAFTQR